MQNMSFSCTIMAKRTGVWLLPHHHLRPVHPLCWWKTGSNHGPFKLIFFSKAAVDMNDHALTHYDWWGFFFVCFVLFLFQSNGLIIILLKMNVFLSFYLLSAWYSSVINIACLGSWIVSGPFAHRDKKSDFHTNPGEGGAHVLSLSLWGQVWGMPCDLWEAISFSGPQFVCFNFYKWIGFQSLTIILHFVSPPAW